MSQRTIAVVTGTRAEFGLLATVMRAVAAHPKLRLRTVVAGAHLVTGTWKDVRDAGFTIDAKVPMQTKGAVGHAADVAALGKGVMGFGRVFEVMKPDFVVVLGDRIEAFAAASAASVGGYRVAHIHGGDRAEGVADEAMRHAITKLSHLHLPATVASRRRIVRMGEPESSVFNVGSPAVDGLRDVTPAANIDFVVLQHPIGESDEQEFEWMNQSLRAYVAELDRMKAEGISIVAPPNLDPGRNGIVRALKRSTRGREPGHIPRDEWLPILASAKVIVGNSSAGLIEAAVLKTPCVNVGPRQNGREKPANVVDCDYGEDNVRRAIRKAMKLDLRRMRHPYGDGRAGERVAQLLSTVDVSVRKRNVY